MRLLAGQVGPAGRVTGVDSDGRLGREGLEMLQATVPGPERFAFVETDVEVAERADDLLHGVAAAQARCHDKDPAESKFLGLRAEEFPCAGTDHGPGEWMELLDRKWFEK